MDVERSSPTFAILSDIGNDLAYETPVEKIVQWIEATLDRLAALGARMVLNNIPLASLEGVGAMRYQVFRELFFPNCKLPRKEMLRRAEQLSAELETVAERRQMPIFSGESAWYGLDPIHPRRALAGKIWTRMLGELITPGGAAELVRPTPAAKLKLRRLQPRSWSQFGVLRSARQPNARLNDGSTIALY
ncbi:MAG: hypothetical protein H0W66_12345 [Chthoniobacterales bacterium]|nr:hypothetical protein [Chthoniobacterales bacterium]